VSLYSETILSAVEDAMVGLGVLGGSKTTPLHVERYDAEKGRTRELPGIRIRRGEEDFSPIGSGRHYGAGLVLSCSLPVQLWVFSRLDRLSSESYDELVAEDVATVMRGILDMDWDALRANPLPITWAPIQIETEEEVEDGAVIRFTVRWQSPVSDLGNKTEFTQ